MEKRPGRCYQWGVETNEHPGLGASPTGSGVGTARLLVVDDSPDSLRVLAGAAEGLGDIFAATSGAEALNVARRVQPDLVLIDIEMPGMDGFELSRRLRADPRIGACPIIFVTSHDSVAHETLSLDEGAVDFIAKPINTNTCRLRIRNHLLLKQRGDQLARARMEMGQLMQSLPALVVYVDQAGVVKYANEDGVEWFGRGKALATGQRLADSLGQAAATQLESLLRRAREGEHVEGEMNLNAAGEIPRIALVSMVQGTAATPAEGFLVLLTDVSRLKQAERSLSEEKERLRVTLNSIGDAVIATDRQGRITFINPIAEKMTGWSGEHALGVPVERVMPLFDAETDRPITNPVYLALREARIVGMQLNTRMRGLGGQDYMVEDSAAPIRDADDQVAGAILVFHDVSEARAMAIKMSHLANHDALTDLPNRTLLQDRLGLAIRQAAHTGRRVALVAMDVDHFKVVNNTAGHHVGDRVIQLLASRFQRCLPANATLARLGGDEFVLLLPDIGDPQEAASVAETFAAAAREHFQFEQGRFDLTLSAGISLHPDDGSDQDAMLRHADVAMFRAKHDGRNQICFFSVELEQRLLERQDAERQLRDALADRRLEVHFQSMVDAHTLEVIGAEALVRLRRKDGSLVPPASFIPLAEETGLIVPIGEVVLRQACLAAARWHAQGRPLRVSVNISARQFAEQGLLAMVADALRESGLDAASLELELTENTLVQDVETTTRLLHALRAMGVRLSIDDFGTGYSSLTYLKTFPADTLKLDQSFVRHFLHDPGDMAIVQAIIALGKAMSLELVAEGVEERAQAERLRELGCEVLQGYLFSRPVPEAQFPPGR